MLIEIGTSKPFRRQTQKSSERPGQIYVVNSMFYSDLFQRAKVPDTAINTCVTRIVNNKVLNLNSRTHKLRFPYNNAVTVPLDGRLRSVFIML